MSITVYVPCDSSAVSLGANRVANAIAQEAQKRGIEINLVRNGSRGHVIAKHQPTPSCQGHEP